MCIISNVLTDSYDFKVVQESEYCATRINAYIMLEGFMG